MKKITIILLLVLNIFSLSAAKMQVIEVSDEQEFVNALGSNRIVRIKNNSIINLSRVLSDPINNPNLAIEDVFDGNQLNVIGLKNLTIEGAEGMPARLMVSPKYSYVLNFVNCDDITIRNLNAGHGPQRGYCTGGVFRFENCNNIHIYGTFMYGCGTEGITAFNVNNLECVDSHIKECSYSIMTLSDSKNIRFEGCQFYDNKKFSLVNITAGCAEIVFDNCLFYLNEGVLFYAEDGMSPAVTLSNCWIDHYDMIGIDEMNLINVEVTKRM